MPFSISKYLLIHHKIILNIILGGNDVYLTKQFKKSFEHYEKSNKNHFLLTRNVLSRKQRIFLYSRTRRHFCDIIS